MTSRRPTETPAPRRPPPRAAPREVAREVLDIEAAAIEGLVRQLDERFDRAVELLRGARERVVCREMGKSGS